jgi:hypothetical protein
MKRSKPISIGLVIIVAVFALKTPAFLSLVNSINKVTYGDDPKQAASDEASKVELPDGVTIPQDLVLPNPFGTETPTTVPGATTTTAAPEPGSPTTTPAEVIDFDPVGAKPGLPVIDTAAEKQAALVIIDEIRVAGRGPKTGYSRDEFGTAWTDNIKAGLFAHNGCDTRNDILKRDLAAVTFRAKTKDCVVITGTMDPEPYTSKPFTFEKAKASALQIDHMIPLSLAWQMGAARWDKDKRVAFANDPLNLLAADGPANGSKGDSSPASWLPKNKAVRCAYSLRIAQVSLRYDVPLTQADKDTMLTQCGA